MTTLVKAGYVLSESEKRALMRRIEDVGGVETLLVRFAEGDTLQQLANDFRCRPSQISGILRSDKWRAKYEEAKKLKAEMAIDRGLRIVRDATPETAGVAKLQWEAERWVAGKLDPDAYGEKQQPLVNISVGSLHLDALRTVNREVLE